MILKREKEKSVASKSEPSYCPPEFQAFLQPNDNYVLHVRATKLEHEQESDATIVFLNHAWLKCQLTPEGNHTLTWRKELVELIHASTGVISTSSKYFLSISDTHNIERRYKMPTQDEAEFAALALNRIIRDAWQRLFEASVIVEPEVYQCHFIGHKINKKGKLQVRVLIASDTALYNAEMSKNQLECGKVKWRVPLPSLQKIVVPKVAENEPDKVVLHLNTSEMSDEGSGKKAAFKEEVTYQLDRGLSAFEVLPLMKSVYLKVAKKTLTVVIDR
eukprot:TRINITY_DN13024_c0_g1_i1.p1 TRINITY_DN13024_c0_g1~~TRINITY_DN13024_c0_g1_i1.p1  ORF type:complete len:275 (+),score=22.67 TRINITY_DN13024_c0_g1_i1:181-1005(+)